MKLNFPVYLTLRALRTLGLVVTAPLWVLVMLLVWLLLEVVVMPIDGHERPDLAAGEV